MNHHHCRRLPSSNPCLHLSAFRSSRGPNPFRSLQPCFKSKPLGPTSVRRDPTGSPPLCSICSSPLSSRLYACLACAAVFCYSPALHTPPHAAFHAAEAGAGHEIAVDLDRAELFCCVCKDQVYDPEFDSAVVRAHHALLPVSQVVNSGAKKRRRDVEYRPWAPDPRESACISRGSCPLPPDPKWGLRGLNNLGNTCFMNSVLQALLHTPPLRNYFLSDRHNRYECQRRRIKTSSGSDGGKNLAGRLCLACDMDEMFSAVFSGERTPYSPAKFLYSWWQYASNLASYEQQDAHEFFISMLDGIHEKVEQDKQGPQSQANGDCCIAHRVFSGILRSDVTCTVCGFTSTTYDPCVDFPLDLEPNQGPTKNASKPHSINGESESVVSCQGGGVSTLMGCLDRFTRPERLGSDQKFFCQNCQVRQESLKQMSIRKLPLVSCFHIKRFEHSSAKNLSRKVDRYLQFPFSLDMSPYLSSSILRGRFGNRIFPFDGDGSDSPKESSSEFELFAVVTHAGKLDAGHYVTYLRLNNQWYKCDDAWISQVGENIVRASQGYMMFYVQKVLHYRSSENLVAS